MRTDQITQMLESAGAIRHGHFELSSGLHSDMYIQCALVLQYPVFAGRLGAALAAEFAGLRIQAVVSPALGGVIIGQETARALGAGPDGRGIPAMFVERDAAGQMCLRRGFSIEPGHHILIVEDVWTTGGSTLEAMRVVEELGGNVMAAGAIIDRSGGKLEFPVRAEALLQMEIASYSPADCPLCRQGSSAMKPGSRFVRAGR
jgi:orotate phosphoribosyltransferase